jgi:hypothetical protein
MQTVHIQCPNGHLLSLEIQHLGKHIRCPMCQIVMVVPVQQVAVRPVPAPMRTAGEMATSPAARQPGAASRPAAPPPRPPVTVGVTRKPVRRPVEEEDEDEEDEEDFGESRRDIRRGMKKVQAGLNFHAIKIWANLGLIGLVFCGLLLLALHPVLGLLALVLIAFVAAAVGLASIILDGLTFKNLMACPVSTRARGLAMAYVALEILHYVTGIASRFLKTPAQEMMVAGISFLLSFAGYLCMVVFLKRLALYMRRRKIADKATVTLILMGLTSFFSMITVFAMASAIPQIIAAAAAERNMDWNEGDEDEFPGGPGDPNQPAIKPPDPPAIAFMVFGLIGALITGIWGFIRYLKLIHEVRDAI